MIKQIAICLNQVYGYVIRAHQMHGQFNGARQVHAHFIGVSYGTPIP